jgi:hypothetical protein
MTQLLRGLHVALLACGALTCASREEPPAAEAPASVAAPTQPATPTPATDHAAHAAPAEGPAPPPPIPAGARVFFQTPPPNMTVRGLVVEGKIEVPVKMGAERILVKPAGPVEAGSGHHHILIDGDPLPAGTVVPKDETHLHYGKGETDAVVALAPGRRKLTMQFADGLHRSYGPELSATIEITLEAEGQAAPATAPHGAPGTPTAEPKAP